MPTITELRDHHRTAVLHSIDVVNGITLADLDRPTPCSGWNLGDLLAHMTVQHRGFAAAARGHGANEEVWRPQTVADAVRADPVGSYTAAAHDVLDAFSAPDIAETSFALPEFGPGATAPGAMAMGFHFVDYVVHGWDVAATLGIAFELPPDTVAAVLPLVMGIPDGDFRNASNAPFARAVDSSAATDFDRILAHLGRRPDWSQSN